MRGVFGSEYMLVDIHVRCFISKLCILKGSCHDIDSDPELLLGVSEKAMEGVTWQVVGRSRKTKNSVLQIQRQRH